MTYYITIVKPHGFVDILTVNAESKEDARNTVMAWYPESNIVCIEKER